MADYSVEVHPRVRSQLDNLDVEAVERIRDKLFEMVTNEWRDLTDFDVQLVRGVANDIYRTRLGDYRVFFVVGGDVIGILHVDDREGAYQNIGHLDDRVDEFDG